MDELFVCIMKFFEFLMSDRFMDVFKIVINDFFKLVVVFIWLIGVIYKLLLGSFMGKYKNL